MSNKGFLLITHHSLLITFILPVAIFSCTGARDEASNQRLGEAMAKGTWAMVKSLRREAHEASETCWLHGEGFCLSTRAIGGASV
jgi:protein-L-isoaspartate(D-aspartate) O-methyltransferase